MTAYEINDNCQKLVLTLTTNSSNIGNLYLRTYINDSNIPEKTYTSSGTGGVRKFNILHSDYEIGDIITKIELVQSGSTHLWETNEGITWLVDGEEYSTQNTNTETVRFRDTGVHTVEAVFVGNNSLAMATTGKTLVNITQPVVDSSGSLDNDGEYKIFLTNNKDVSEIEYSDETKFNYRLTKGGVPVPSRTVERVTPTMMESINTNKEGIVTITNKNYPVGKYKIGAFYQDERTHKTISSSYKNITIKKAPVTITDNFEDKGTFVKGSKYKVVFKFKNKAIADTKVSLYVNNKLNTLTTDKTGAIYYEFKSNKTYILKAVFLGDKNLKKTEATTRTITIKE